IYDERNPRARAFLQHYTERFGPPAHLAFTLAAYDAARALFEGIALASILTRDGVRSGLERVKRLSATMGGEGAYISFGPWDHRGVKGRDALCLRELDGQGGWRLVDISPASL